MILFAGLSLFFLGIEISKTGAKQYGSSILNKFLDLASSSVFRQVTLGFLLTLLLQSSSATTVLLMSLGATEILSLKMAYPMLLGAGVGTTIVVKIISFRLSSIAPFLMLSGIFLYSLSKGKTLKLAGSFLLSFGLIFFGMDLMESDIQNHFEISSIINMFGRSSPLFFLFLMGFLLTGILQASAIVIGLAMVLASSGKLDLAHSFAIVLGANAGTTITGLIAALNTPGEGRRIGALNSFLKVIGAILFLLIHYYLHFDRFFNAIKPETAIANFHIFYNVLMLLIFLPLRKPVCNVFVKLWKTRVPLRERFKLKYINEKFSSPPAIALKSARKEIAMIAEEVKEMITRIPPSLSGNYAAIEEIRERDELIDFVEKKVRLFLTVSMKEELTGREALEEVSLVLLANNLENIADVVTKNISFLAEKKLKKVTDFSEEGREELDKLYSDLLFIMDNLIIAIKTLKSEDIKKLRQLVQNFRDKIYAYHINHIERLRAGLKESIVTSSVHIDLLSGYEKIYGHLMNCIYSLEAIVKEL